MGRTRQAQHQSAPPERKVGRTDPPFFMFHPLRTTALETLHAGNGLASKLVTLVAPVGYGKTVLMSMLFADLRRTGKRCLWFALDERDTTVEGVVGALGSLLDARDCTVPPMAALFRDNEPADRRIDALVDLVNNYPVPLVFFIDNLNYCTDSGLGKLLDRLVFGTTPTVQFVLSSTQALPVNISRASLEGLVQQMGHAELSFNGDEIRQLFGAELCARIAPHGVEEVLRHTEGWPAAARMAQIILTSTSQPMLALENFSGSDEGLAHLLNRQVLSGLPENVRDFLLCIAPLRAVCADLVAYAIGSDTAQEDLAYLLLRNVFVIPLDRNRQWYRLQGLFREYLLGEAARILPAARRQDVLHRAALWCEKQGYWQDAVDYAIDCGEVSVATKILEHSAQSFVGDRGDLHHYIKWIETFHERGQQAGLEAEYWFAWALSFCRRYEYARQQTVSLEMRLDEHGADRPPAANESALRRRIAILRSSIDSLTDRLDDAQRGAEAWLAGMATHNDDPFNVSAAYCIVSCCSANQFRFVQARRFAQAARESAFQAHSPYVDGWVAAYTALIPVFEGDYAAAYAELLPVLAAVRAAMGDGSGICGTVTLIAAKCAVEMGLDAEARQLIQLGMQSLRTHGFLEAADCGGDAALLLWSGAKDDPLGPATLRDVASCYPPRLAVMLSCHLIRRLIVLGRKDEAVAEAGRVGLTLDAGCRPGFAMAISSSARYQELIDATRIDLLVATGHTHQAEALIDEEAKKAKASGRMARQVELELARAALAARSDRLPQAARSLMRAVSLAAPRRIVRPFDDHGEIVLALVKGEKLTASAFVLQDERRFFGDICQRLPQGDQGLKERIDAMQGEPRLLSTLTPREVELLALVDAGLSNQQLADRTNVSVATIKWHLQNLYRKLGVTRRSAALARARALSLLHH